MTTPLARATLWRLRYSSTPGKNKPVTVRTEGPELPVQFNPASLKISRRNNVDRGGVTTGTQKRQNPAQEASTLSFDLEFDTTEQGDGGTFVDVRNWTAVVRQFVEPPPDNPSAAAPAVRFAWGTLVFDGIIDQVTEDLDHFAWDGTPLRAKVSVSISEQNFKYENKQQGAGARDAKGAVDPGAPPRGRGPGSSGDDDPDQMVRAKQGESVQQVLARLGLDPAAWRAAMNGLSSPIGLTAGTPVQLGAGVSVTGAVAAAAGFAAGAAVTSPETLSAALTVGGKGELSAVGTGFALAAGGGIAATTSQVAQAQVNASVTASVGSFAVPSSTGVCPSVPFVDPRSLTYGRAIPLAVRGDTGTLAEARLGGSQAVTTRARRSEER